MDFLASLKGKTVLVTGATGFIGSHLVERLRKDADVRLVLLSRGTASEICEGITWVRCALDCLLPNTWLASGVKQIDVVFHLGAFTPKTGEAADRVEEVYRDNLLGTRRLLESLPQTPERIVFSSAIDVYSQPPEGRVLDEDSHVGPKSLYGISKLFCEQLVRVYARMHRCGFAILRYGNIFGPGEVAYGKLIPQTIRKLMNGESPVVYGDGNAERDLLYVEDAVEATLRAAVADMQELGAVNIVRGASTAVRGIVEMLMCLTGFSGDIVFLPGRSPECSLRFDNRRMREALGDWRLVSLEDGLRREIEYFKSLQQ